MGEATTEHNITTSVDGAVGLITIDRRERFNALDVDTARALRKAGLRMARDEAVRAVIIRGSHGVFCSGADLKYIRAGGEAGDLRFMQPSARPRAQGYGEVFKQILEYLHSTISEIRRAPKPFIAAVDGIAAAGGLGLAMCCDLVVASARSTFEYAYFKTALTGAESNTFLLPRLLGMRRALDLALLNPRLSAAEARDWGLVSTVFADDTFATETAALAQRLAAGPTGSYAGMKRLMNEALQIDRLDGHLDREIEALERVANGPDFAEGLTAFFEKRAPKFQGKG